DETIPSIAGAPPPALTREGQELVSVVVVAAPPSSADEAIAATVDAGAPVFDRARLGEALAPFGARLEWLAAGPARAPGSAEGAATDQAVRAARCALAIRRALPDVAMVVATGRGMLAGRGPIGEVIERAVRLLRVIVPGGTLASGPESPSVARDGYVPIGL